MKGSADDFLISLGILWFGERILRFCVVVNGVFVVGREVVCVRMVKFGVMVLELDFSFWVYFCLEHGGMKE